jgi:hypothetical protein
MGKEDHAPRSGRRASGCGGGLLAKSMTSESSSRTLRLLPFGIPTLIIADDPQLLAAARAAYAMWSVEAPIAGPALELRLEIGHASSTEVSFEIGVEGSRLRLSGDAVAGAADATTGLAWAQVPAALADDPVALTELMDSLLLFMLARRGRTPVHAAAFMLGEGAVALAGPSGSGKSTLALAAAQDGYPLLSDDTIFVQREPGFALWGFPRAIHLFPEDSPAGDHPTRIRNAKLKKAILAPKVALKAQSALLVLLERGDRLALAAIDPADAVQSLMRLDPGFDLLAAESRAAIGALASRGAWRLTLERDPAAAIRLLAANLPLARSPSR